MQKVHDPRRARILAAVEELLDAFLPEPAEPLPQAAPVPAAPAPLVSKQKCAAALDVSPATLDRLCRAGRIPFVIVGDVRRFDIAAVCAALETHTPQTPTMPPPSSAQSRNAISPSGVRLLSRPKASGGRR